MDEEKKCEAEIERLRAALEAVEKATSGSDYWRWKSIRQIHEIAEEALRIKNG